MSPEAAWAGAERRAAARLARRVEELRGTNAYLSRTLAGVELLHTFQERLDIAATREELVGQLLKRAHQVRHSHIAAVLLVDEETYEFEVKGVSPRGSLGYVRAEVECQVEADVFGAMVSQRKPMVVATRSSQGPNVNVRSLILVPLIAGFQLLGALLVGVDMEQADVQQDTLRLLSIACKQFALTLRNQTLYNNLWKEKVNLEVARDDLATKVTELETTRDQLETSLRELKLKTAELEHFKAELEHKVAERTKELVAANKELDRLSSIDGLTGIFNRRHLDEALARENERIHRYDVQTAVLVCDLNGLKKINDEAGHLMGDMAIKEAAQLLKRTARRTDTVARFGGDEYVVLAPHTADAKGFVERIHRGLDDWNRQHGKQNFELSLSIGWAVADKETDLFAAMQQADDRMYKDKEAYYEARGGKPRDSAQHLQPPAS
ncbi:MAG TPA: diguanylate cyclase [Chloroflexota bacterium]|nr:diguanylate cyclase [Chloroflexota bacterium]